MFMIRRKMDPKLIGKQWANFLRQQQSQLSSQVSSGEDLSNNPYYSKYADKLKEAKLNSSKSKPKFNSDLSEEERRTKEKFVELERKLTKKDSASADLPSDDRSTKSSKIKKLDDIVKLDLIKDLDKEAIKKIWYEYFKMKDGRIFAYLDAKNFDLISENASKYPVFVFILPVCEANLGSNDQQNENNYQFVLVQFQADHSLKSLHAHFTPLAFFHTHQENAPTTLTLNYYVDFKQEKDLVLMEGEYDCKIFNLIEAQCLANQIQLFYADLTKRPLLDKFTNNPNAFDHAELVAEFEKCLKI